VKSAFSPLNLCSLIRRWNRFGLRNFFYWPAGDARTGAISPEGAMSRMARRQGYVLDCSLPRKGVAGFSPGFQPREASNETVRPHKALRRCASGEKHPVLRVGGAERAQCVGVRSEFGRLQKRHSLVGGVNDAQQGKYERLGHNVPTLYLYVVTGLDLAPLKARRRG